jgi:large subunit ribosomal protein L21e
MTGKRIGGYRRRSRYKLSKGVREKGKIKITRYFQEFEMGEEVKLSLEPAIHKGIFHPRFNGKRGLVTTKNGNCYGVMITDISKPKLVIVHPVHLISARNE